MLRNFETLACNCFSWLVALAVFVPYAWAQVSAVQQPDRVEFLHDGKLITSYLFRSGTKPVLWPIHGPDRVRMTRNYPLDATIPGEDHDHPHHRGLWMTFGEVEGKDWWAEGKGKGVVAHHKIIDVKQTDQAATLLAEHHWLLPTEDEKSNPAPLVRELCRYTVSVLEDETILDCEFILQSADPNRALHFGDTKEGMFAIRVPETMRGDKPGGMILNSVGDRQGDAWGKSARWVDYSGPVTHSSDTPYGIAILVHPSSFHADGLWHVRTYGLFAHNPFGIKDFVSNRTKTPSTAKDPSHAGGYDLPAGESLHFHYRVICHRGRWSLETGDARFAEFAKTEPQQFP